MFFLSFLCYTDKTNLLKSAYLLKGCCYLYSKIGIVFNNLGKLKLSGCFWKTLKNVQSSVFVTVGNLKFIWKLFYWSAYNSFFFAM